LRAEVKGEVWVIVKVDVWMIIRERAVLELLGQGFGINEVLRC
jgi:hypothetical protein